MTQPLSQADLLRDEIDILYAISNKLTQASTPAEWLEAVSVYARERGASSGLLSWINLNDETYFEVIAAWDNGGCSPGGIGTRFDLSDFSDWLGQWAASANQPILIGDAVGDAGLPANTLLFDSCTRGCVVLPLNIKRRWVGVLVFTWTQPRLFDERDKRIFTAIFQQAPPVIDSMRQFEQNSRRARRAEQLLTVSSALSQATNEQEILAAVALCMEQMSPAGTLTLCYAENDNEGQLARLIPITRYRNGTSLELTEMDSFAQFLDPDFWRNTNGEISFVEAVTPGIYMPLLSNARWQGLLAVQWSEPRQFSHSEHNVYRAIQQNVAAVVASRRAYLAEQEIRKEHELLFQTSTAINAANNFEEIVSAVSKLNFNDGEIFLALFENYSITSASYVEIVAQSKPPDAPGPYRISLDKMPILKTLTGRGIYGYENIARNPDIDDLSRAYFLSQRIQCSLGIALSVNDRWAGVLSISHRSPRHYTAQEKRMLEGIGTLVEAAVERIRLRHDTETAREHAERLANEAQKVAALEERNRLARELHDSVSQALYGIALGARTARKLLDRGDPAQLREPLDYVLSLAEAGLTEMRALIFDLRPDALVSEGLVAALEKQAQSIHARHGINVVARLCPEPSAPDKIKEELYRIAREALHNAVKHASPTEIIIEMTCDAQAITVEIVDNGAGFDLHDSFPGHFGLKSMWERTYKLGGFFDVWSERSKGTRVHARLPVA
jgi:signal transduction histidine kinase